jgi:hypothetical protein
MNRFPKGDPRGGQFAPGSGVNSRGAQLRQKQKEIAQASPGLSPQRQRDEAALSLDRGRVLRDRLKNEYKQPASDLRVKAPSPMVQAYRALRAKDPKRFPTTAEVKQQAYNTGRAEHARKDAAMGLTSGHRIPKPPASFFERQESGGNSRLKDEYKRPAGYSPLREGKAGATSEYKRPAGYKPLRELNKDDAARKQAKVLQQPNRGLTIAKLPDSDARLKMSGTKMSSTKLPVASATARAQRLKTALAGMGPGAGVKRNAVRGELTITGRREPGYELVKVGRNAVSADLAKHTVEWDSLIRRKWNNEVLSKQDTERLAKAARTVKSYGRTYPWLKR